MDKKIVARLMDGRVFKGVTEDFHPGDESIAVKVTDGPWKGEKITVEVSDLKAIFFVRDLGGNRDYREKKLIFPADAPGQKVTVTFRDGETIRGTAMGLNLGLNGFFLFPADANSNNRRIFIVRAALRNIHEDKAKG